MKNQNERRIDEGLYERSGSVYVEDYLDLCGSQLIEVDEQL